MNKKNIGKWRQCTPSYPILESRNVDRSYMYIPERMASEDKSASRTQTSLRRNC